MLTVAETYERLRPRVRTLAGVLHEDPDLTAVGAALRLHGNDYEVRLERLSGKADARGLKLTVRAGRMQFYRGQLAQFYGAAERAKREGRRAA